MHWIKVTNIMGMVTMRVNLDHYEAYAPDTEDNARGTILFPSRGDEVLRVKESPAEVDSLVQGALEGLPMPPSP